VEDGSPAGAIHFEYRSMAMLPAKCGCAIQDAVCIQNYSRRGVRSIRRTVKTVQHGFRATVIELEDGPAAAEVDVASRVGAAEKGGSVDIARRISGHTSLGPSPIRKVTGTVEWDRSQ